MFREPFPEPRWTFQRESVWRPPTDVYETDDSAVVIVEIAGQSITNIYDYTYALQGRKPGEKVTLVVQRTEDGKTADVPVELTLGSRPDATK